MNEKRMFKILKKLFTIDELTRISKYIIFPIGNNEDYNLYNEYCISHKDGIVTARKNKTFTVKQFYSLRNALIWVILDKSNKILEANRIVNLDLLYASNLAQIEQQKQKIKNNKDLDIMSLAATKLTESTYKNEKIKFEIEQYASMTNKWQNNNFAQITK